MLNQYGHSPGTDRPDGQTDRRTGHTYLFWRPAAREEVPVVVAMEGDVQHVGVVVEGLLGAVTVVNVLNGGGGESGG